MPTIRAESLSPRRLSTGRFKARAGVTALGLCALGGVSESLFELSNITSVWYVNASSRFLLIYLVTIPTERFHYQITTRPVSYATVSRQACVYRLAR